VLSVYNNRHVMLPDVMFRVVIVVMTLPVPLLILRYIPLSHSQELMGGRLRVRH
jgi:hypothetical protein